MMTQIPVTVLTLLAANLFVLINLLQGNINIGETLVLYWIETIVIGIINIVKMLSVHQSSLLELVSKLMYSGFFVIHYGFFNIVHGAFILMLSYRFLTPQSLTHIMSSAIAIAVSHVISLGYNYIYQGEYRRTSLLTLFTQPYRRVVIMHLTLMAAFFLSMTTVSPLAVGIMMITIKTIVDAYVHLKERQQFSS